MKYLILIITLLSFSAASYETVQMPTNHDDFEFYSNMTPDEKATLKYNVNKDLAELKVSIKKTKAAVTIIKMSLAARKQLILIMPEDFNRLLEVQKIAQEERMLEAYQAKLSEAEEMLGNYQSIQSDIIYFDKVLDLTPL